MSTTEIRPGSARAWLLAARPATLSAAMVPVLVGTAVAAVHGSPRFGPAIGALLGALLIQIGTNFANDVFDYRKGADTDERRGPIRAAQAGLLAPGELTLGMILAFAAATACGVYLAWIGGWPIIAIGTASILAGVAYTGGPYPLGYNGLGDVFVLVFFGLVAVTGTAYLQLGEVSALALWLSIPIGALATAILAVNNLRDADTDRKCGKRTVAVRFGRRAVRGEYLVLLSSAYAVPVVAVLSDRAPAGALLCLASAPLALRLAVRMHPGQPAEVLNRCLRATAALLLVHGVLLTTGLLWSAI